jgi:cholesterol transport system auxiliary component
MNGAGVSRLILLAACGLLTACSTSSLFDSDTPVPTSYVLGAAPAGRDASEALAVDVSVSRPDMAAGLDSDRIAVLGGRKLDYYRGVKWGARTTEMVQALVVDSLEDQRWFRSVTPEQARVAGDYVLDLQVRAFQAELTQGPKRPSVHVAFVGRLIRVVDRALVATVTADARVDAKEDRMSLVAAAFEEASHRAILELGQQLAVAVKQDAETLRTLRGGGRR